MKSLTAVRQQVQVCIGKAGTPVGQMIYIRQGAAVKTVRLPMSRNG